MEFLSFQSGRRTPTGIAIPQNQRQDFRQRGRHIDYKARMHELQAQEEKVRQTAAFLFTLHQVQYVEVYLDL